jgi:hypothetical protein
LKSLGHLVAEQFKKSQMPANAENGVRPNTKMAAIFKRYTQKIQKKYFLAP